MTDPSTSAGARREEEPAGALRYRHYLALGDSISIDLYPGLDAAEREELPVPPDGLGAASLLHRNDDDRWPSFRGRDLASRCPGIDRTDLCADGATTGHVLRHQLPGIPDGLEEPVLVTLTVGGNDLLGLIDPLRRLAGLLPWSSRASHVAEISDRVERAVARLRDRLPRSTLVVGTVYDPTDGTGRLEGMVRPEGLELLHDFNDRIRALGGRKGVRVADIHERFLGHGVGESEPGKRWYWRHSIIEPSARGAHEVRRLWWETLTAERGRR